MQSIHTFIRQSSSNKDIVDDPFTAYAREVRVRVRVRVGASTRSFMVLGSGCVWDTNASAFFQFLLFTAHSRLKAGTKEKVPVKWSPSTVRY